MTCLFFIKGELKSFSFATSLDFISHNLPWGISILKPISIVLFLICCFSTFADKSLISVVISRNRNVSYVNIAPLYYEAKKKGFILIQDTPEHPFKNGRPKELRPMELIIYSTCNRGNPEHETALGFRAQFLKVNFLINPHPNDLPAVHYLSPIGLFRMLKEAVRGHPYFYEEGTIRIETHNEIWKVNIQRSDTTAVNSKTDYFVEFVKEADQPLFIKALMLAAKPAKNNIPQVTILLESPNLHVKAVYALIHKGTRQYQPIKTMNVLKWWNKQQKWCPEEQRS